MIYQRVKLNPLSRMTRPNSPHDGIPVRWSVSDPTRLPVLPTDEAWVVVEDRPEFDQSTQRLVRVLTAERDGWDIVDLTAEEIAIKNQFTGFSIQQITPVSIIEKLVALGKWDLFENTLSQLPSFVEKSFYAAQYIDKNNHFFLKYGEDIRLGLGITTEELENLLKPEVENKNEF